MSDTMTEKELAARWKLTPRTLQTWRYTGSGPQFIRIGDRSILYRTEDVIAYEAANVRKLTPKWQTAVRDVVEKLNQRIAADPQTTVWLASIRDELNALLPSGENP